MFEKNNGFRFSRLFAIYNRRFRNRRTLARMSTLPDMITSFQLPWNDVKMAVQGTAVCSRLSAAPFGEIV